MSLQAPPEIAIGAENVADMPSLTFRGIIQESGIHSSWLFEMISSERKAILQALAEMSELHPDWRFGQMVVGITCMAAVGEPSPIYDIEDEDSLRGLLEYLESRRRPQDLIRNVLE